MLYRTIHRNFLVNDYSGGVGGIDNDDGSKQFLRYNNFLVFGGIKERGSAEQATHSLYAYASGDIAEGEGGDAAPAEIGTTGRINRTIVGRLGRPKRIANNSARPLAPPPPPHALCSYSALVLCVPRLMHESFCVVAWAAAIILRSKNTNYHICQGWQGEAFGNRFYGQPGSQLHINSQGCCSNCNVSCCATNCTKRCQATSFTLEQWQRQDPSANDAGTTLTRTMPGAEEVIGWARKVLRGEPPSSAHSVEA
jgi:hypothetical protein